MKTGVDPGTVWVNGLSFDRHVCDYCSDDETLPYNAPPGYAIKSYNALVNTVFGQSGYMISMVAGGSHFISLSELQSKFTTLINAAVGDEKAKLIVILNAHVEGDRCWFCGGGRVSLVVQVEIIMLDPWMPDIMIS